MKRVLVLAAHDDDAILGVGGRIFQHIKNGDEVCVVFLTDGRNSHRLGLGIKKEPTVWQVKEKRKEEIEKAMQIIGVNSKRLHFLDFIDGEGKSWKHNIRVYDEVSKITSEEKPNIIYFNSADSHVDHQAVNKIALKVLKNFPKEIEAYQFFIWTRRVAVLAAREMAGQFFTKVKNEIGDRDICRSIKELKDKTSLFFPPKIPREAMRVSLEEDELLAKRQALHAIVSQTSIWPYPDWQVQGMSILVPSFVKYVLESREEIFLRVK